MKVLDKCRKPAEKSSSVTELLITVLITFLGLGMGILSKSLDCRSLYDNVTLDRIIAALDLNNVFSRLSVWALAALIISVRSRTPLRAAVNTVFFFAGMLIGYYGYTVLIAGFFPKQYIIAWTALAAASSVPAYFSWYSKGKGRFSVIMASFILGFFAAEAFHFGRWYLIAGNWDAVVCLLLAAVVLFKDWKTFAYSLIGMCVTAPLVDYIIPHIFGGL